METKDFGMGFMGKGFFGEDFRKNLHEKWSKMSDSEKVEFVNKKMDFMGHGECGPSVESIDAHCDAWMKKTPEEKQEFVDGLKKSFHERMMHCGGHSHGFGKFGFAGGMNENV
jgi:hypothetical protein